MSKLAVFDFDSTLMDGETLEFLAEELGIKSEIKEITDKAMLGELDFFESLTKRVMLLKGLSESKVDATLNDLFQKILHLSGKQTDKVGIPSLISRMTTDTYNIHHAINNRPPCSFWNIPSTNYIPIGVITRR